jgi:hypothetical protein
MAVKQFTAEEFAAYVLEQYGDDAPDIMAQTGRWLARGDGVAVYENHDMGHPELGWPRLASYGSPAAILETDTPPERLPDTPTLINWRYVLIGTYRPDPEV